MPASAKRVAAKVPARKPIKAAKSAPRPAAAPRLGQLPEWYLTDLYAGIDDPAVKRDLDRTDQYAAAFEEDFKGKLASLADAPDAGRAPAEAVRRYEGLDDLIGRLASYAGLIH